MRTPPVDDIPKLTKALGVGEDRLLEQLRTMPAEELRDISVSMGLPTTGGAIDGVVITRHPLQAICERGARGVPLIVGSTRDEGTLLAEVGGVGPGIAEAIGSLVMDGGNPTRYLAALRAAHPQADSRAIDIMVWTHMFRRTAVHTAETSTVAGPGGWLYRFDLPSVGLGGRLGAPHGAEIPFTFNLFAANAAGIGKGVRNTGAFPLGLYDAQNPDVRKLAEAWSRTLVAFARTGDPNGGGLPAWPRYSAADRASLVVDASSRIAHGLDDGNLKVWGDA